VHGGYLDDETDGDNDAPETDREATPNSVGEGSSNESPNQCSNG
jgi:hypothetical protein